MTGSAPRLLGGLALLAAAGPGLAQALADTTAYTVYAAGDIARLSAG